MRTAGSRRGAARGVAVLWLAALAACASPATRQPPVAAPAPCADSIHVHLARQQPHGRSRSAQPPEVPERDCATARAESRRGAGGIVGTGHGAGRRMGAVAGAVMMIVMLFAML